MKGKLYYERENEKKILKIIEGNSELQGFYAFLSSNESSTTMYNYLAITRNFLKYVNKTTDQLKLDDFSSFMLFKQTTKEGNIASAAYRIGIYHALKKYGEYLEAKGALPGNPMDKIKRPVLKESEETIQRRERGFLEKEEIKKYLDAAEEESLKDPTWGKRDIAILKIFLGTGIRNSAMHKIDVSSVDFIKKTLTVTDKESTVNVHKLSESILSSIKEWMEEREKILNGKEEEALFISNRRTRLTQRAIYNVVTKYAADIKGKKISPHKLRATYGSQLYQETEDIYFVQRCMTHANPKTTALYIRGQKNQTEKAANIMEKFMN